MKKWLLLCSLVAGCGPEFAVIPQGGAPHVTTNTQGVYMSAFHDQWEAEPHDLADTLTPIAVDLYNGTGAEIRVSLMDFALRGQDGQRRPALNPFAEQLSMLDGNAAPDELALRAGPLVASRAPLLLASRGGGGGHGGGGHFGGGHHSGGSHGSGWRGGSRGGWRGGTWSGGSHRWGPGFYLHGGMRRYYGSSALYWSGAWAYPLGYTSWVYGWGTTGYAATDDVMEYALPEGVLAPGASINGFLYFTKATGPGVHTVTLSWTPTDARSGAPVGQAQFALEVVHR